jgi:hypothetical protein
MSSSLLETEPMEAQPRTKDHVVDYVLDMMLQKIPARRLDNKADIPAISVYQIGSSLVKLNQRTKALSHINIHLKKFFSWEQPAYTLSLLCIYSVLCYRPYLVVCIPGIAVLVGVMVPGFAHRHPFPDQYLPPTRSRRHEFDDMIDSADEDTAKLKPRRSGEEQSKDMLAAVRDIQKILTDVNRLFDSIETVFYGPGSFVDERHSSAIFLLIMYLVFASGVGASLIPWNTAFAVAGWCTALLMHPAIKHKARQVQKEYLAGREKALEELIAQYEHWDVVLDETDEPEDARDVEIFELERQGLTPRIWDPWVFSPLIYSDRSAWRLSESRPPGARLLESVEPPPGWYFDDDLHPWALDPNTKAWVLDRAVQNVEIDIDDHWVYDYKDGLRGEWRRRRLVRRCFRKSAPPRRKKI